MILYLLQLLLIKNEAFNHVNVYSNELKKKNINYYISQINQLEYSYQLFNTINNDLLRLIQLIILNYNNDHYNYYLRENINNIIDEFEISIYKYNYKDTEGIIKYYNSYNILKNYPNKKFNIDNIKEIKTINAHRKYVTSLLILKDGRLASCSYDSKIKIFNIKNDFHCDITIQTGHTKCISYISQLNNSKLLSCSFKVINIWSITNSSYQCDYTFFDAHLNWIYTVIPLINNRIASCSEDKTIKIWNGFEPYNLITTLNGHDKFINLLIELKGKNILISGSWDCTLNGI